MAAGILPSEPPSRRRQMHMDKAKPGRLVAVESGEYSDYSVIGFFVVLQEFDPIAELESYLSEHPDERESYRFCQGQYLSMLLRRGYLLEIDYATLHLSDSGSADELRFHLPGQD